MRKWCGVSLFIATLSIFIAIALIGSAQAADRPVLRVGTDATFPPFEFVNEKGQYVGFDMDLIRLIGAELGMDVRIVNTSFDGLIPGLMANQFDCIIAGMTVTDERAKSVAFSTPYFNAGQVIVVRTNDQSIHGVGDLKGKVVTTQLGTTGQLVVDKMTGLKEHRVFNTVPEAVQEVLQGRADAAVIDLPVAADFLRSQPGKFKIVGKPFTNEVYAIAVRKDNPALLAKINQALKQIEASGKFDALYKEWIMP